MTKTLRAMVLGLVASLCLAQIPALAAAATKTKRAEPVGTAAKKLGKARKPYAKRQPVLKASVKTRRHNARAFYQDMRKGARVPAADALSFSLDRDGNPLLKSSAFMVQELDSGKVLLERNAHAILPIASITKLMTVMVVLDAGQSLSEVLEITDEHTDKLKGTSSRLAVGTRLSRETLIHLALMSSENRAAAALAYNYPGGIDAFVRAMNGKAQLLGLAETRFHDSTGLNPDNVASARDLAQMVSASAKYPLIREFSTDDIEEIEVMGRLQTFRNTNALVRSPDWEISVSKTGFINEAGRCLVMQAWLANKPMVIVLLDSVGKFTRVADAQRVKRWVEQAIAQRASGGSPAG